MRSSFTTSPALAAVAGGWPAVRGSSPFTPVSDRHQSASVRSLDAGGRLEAAIAGRSAWPLLIGGFATTEGALRRKQSAGRFA